MLGSVFEGETDWFLMIGSVFEGETDRFLMIGSSVFCVVEVVISLSIGVFRAGESPGELELLMSLSVIGRRIFE